MMEYNRDDGLEMEWIMCGKDGKHKTDMILCGYIRKFIQPFVRIIPLDIVNMCLIFLYNGQWGSN